MFPLDAGKEFIVKVGAESTGHAQQWLIDKIHEIIKYSMPTKLIKNQDSVIYEAHINRYTWNPFWLNQLGASDLGYFEIYRSEDDLIIKYKILFHETFLYYLYYILLVFLILLLIPISIFPWKVGLLILFILGYVISYYSTLVWFNMIIREFISDYLFRQKQGDFAKLIES